MLAKAVERRLIADVPLGAFLSGGLDSSSIVAVMAELADRPVRTFSIGFDDKDGFDERPYARLVARRFHTDHTEFVVRPDAADLVDRLVWHHDQPFGDSSALPTFLLSELTRSHVTVALSGDGGDEIFGGYERFAAALAVDRLGRVPRVVRASLKAGAALLPRHLPGAGRVRRLLGATELGLPLAFLSWINYVPGRWRHALVPNASDWAVEDYVRIWAEPSEASTLERLLLLNLRTYLLDDLLPKVDRMSMAHSLEVRSPFLDAELVDMVMALPDNVRVRGLTLKRVLRHAMKDVLPREVLRRPKHGFGVPLGRWFRTDLSGYLEGHLCAPSSRVRAHVAGRALDGLIAEHQSGLADHSTALWTLLTLEVFLRQWGW
jgi:asparagine synthase (glutamine-hydrolysing)